MVGDCSTGQSRQWAVVPMEDIHSPPLTRAEMAVFAELAWISSVFQWCWRGCHFFPPPRKEWMMLHCRCTQARRGFWSTLAATPAGLETESPPEFGLDAVAAVSSSSTWAEGISTTLVPSLLMATCTWETLLKSELKKHLPPHFL